MAKKRKEKTEEEELDIQLPKFDEQKFLQRERRNIKTLFISFGLGLLIAVISFGFWALLKGSPFRWELVLLLGIFNASWLKYIFLKLNIDLTDFGRKGWFTSFGVYFFTWLVLMILLCNPPFYDDELPQINLVALPGAQEVGGTVLVVAHITDNVGVKTQGINFTLWDPNGTVSYPEFSFKDNIFKYTYQNSENLMGAYHFSLVASDVNGNVNNGYTNMTFEYSNDALGIISSRFTDIRSGDPIVISANENIHPWNFRVYYTLDNGSQINVDRKDVSDKTKYETSAEFQGWKENKNFTVTVYAEVTDYFVNIPERFNNTIIDTTPYNTTTYHFSTETDPNIGTKTPLVEYNQSLAALRKDQLPNTLNYQLPYPIGVGNIPGFEAVIFLVALVGVVLLLKRRKKESSP